MLGKLLALLETGERDRFAAHLYQSRREYRRVCETTGKSSKQIERCVISTFQIAESMGFKGDFRQWGPHCELANNSSLRAGKSCERKQRDEQDSLAPHFPECRRMAVRSIHHINVPAVPKSWQ